MLGNKDAFFKIKSQQLLCTVSVCSIEQDCKRVGREKVWMGERGMGQRGMDGENGHGRKWGREKVGKEKEGKGES